MTRRLLAAIALASLPVSAPATPSGLAWDSVTKITMNADSSTLQPGDFSAEFAAAAAVQAPGQNGGGGIFGQWQHAMAAGQSYQQMMQTGIAQRHYVAGSKERTDNLATQTATIVDCGARTITTLDLRRKTYKIVSMDQPASPSGGVGGSHAGANDDGTRVAIALTSGALGARVVGDQPTNGYRAEITFTETNASGESHQQSASMIGYYSNLARPMPSCSGGPIMGSVGGPGMVAGYERLMQALAKSGFDSRFSVKQSGPPLPLGKLSMYDAMSFGAAAGGQGPTFVSERGDVRPISANDPAFSVPVDFTQQR